MVTRVIPVAEELGAKTYAPTSKVAANWLKNNTRWIKDQIKSGRQIFDIGIDAARERSKYYQREVQELTKAGLSRVHRGSVTVKKKTYEIYEWVRK